MQYEVIINQHKVKKNAFMFKYTTVIMVKKFSITAYY